MFRQRIVPSSELVSTPAPRLAAQSMDFRPPEKPQAPPVWCDGPLAGEAPGGGGLNGVNTIRQFWRDMVDPDEVFTVQLVAEDVIVGSGVRRSTRIESSVKTGVLGTAQARRMAVALIEAADLIDRT